MSIGQSSALHDLGIKVLFCPVWMSDHKKLFALV